MFNFFKFKADNKNVNFPTQFCLGSISNGFSATESREMSLDGNVYNQLTGFKNFFVMPYEIVHDIVRYTYNFPVSQAIYSLFLMKLQKY